jgi:hypothetical protein
MMRVIFLREFTAAYQALIASVGWLTVVLRQQRLA